MSKVKIQMTNQIPNFNDRIRHLDFELDLTFKL